MARCRKQEIMDCWCRRIVKETPKGSFARLAVAYFVVYPYNSSHNIMRMRLISQYVLSFIPSCKS